MGAIAPIASGLTTLVTAVNAANTIVQSVQTLSGNSPREREQDLALKQLQERQNLNAQQLEQNSTLERERIATQAAQDEDDRRSALRRAVARQRAQFGSSGVSQGNGGSSQAVLLGLFDETEDELAQREQLDNIRTRALEIDQGQANSLNLLQATQLQQRQDLNNRLNRFS